MSSSKFRKHKRLKEFQEHNDRIKIHPEENPDWPARASLAAFINQNILELQYRAYDGKKIAGDGVLVASFDARTDSTNTYWMGKGAAQDLVNVLGDEMPKALLKMSEFADENGYTVMICEYINPKGGSQRCTTCIEPAPRPGGTTEHMGETSFSRN